MEEERKINENTGNMLKQALERRQTERLSSNFSYRMMERVHQADEAENESRLGSFADIGFGVGRAGCLCADFLSGI